MNYFVDTYKTPLLWISQERAAIEMMAHLPSCIPGETTIEIFKQDEVA
jgi:hypothetical protein